MKVFLVDNYDSFTYNLVFALKTLGAEVTVRRNDKFDLGELDGFKKIVISPGPGIPSEAGITQELIRRLGREKSILGVCLGHQALAEVYGARLENLREVSHGKAVDTLVLERSDPLFQGIEPSFPSGRYHSWAVERGSIPEMLAVTAEDPAGRVMALRHREHDVVGVQFHPESVLTPAGPRILSNWLGAVS